MFAGGVRRAAWRGMLEVNDLESVFSADWQPLASAHGQTETGLTQGELLGFSAIEIAVPPNSVARTSIVRATADVRFFGKRRHLLDTWSLVPTGYGARDGSFDEGCPAFLPG
jgi:hypothetical protein